MLRTIDSATVIVYEEQKALALEVSVYLRPGVILPLQLPRVMIARERTVDTTLQSSVRGARAPSQNTLKVPNLHVFNIFFKATEMLLFPKFS